MHSQKPMRISAKVGTMSQTNYLSALTSRQTGTWVKVPLMMTNFHPTEALTTWHQAIGKDIITIFLSSTSLELIWRTLWTINSEIGPLALPQVPDSIG